MATLKYEAKALMVLKDSLREGSGKQEKITAIRGIMNEKSKN